MLHRLASASVLFLAACGVRSPLTDDLLFASDSGAPPVDAAPARDATMSDAPDAPVDAAPDVALPATDLGNVFLETGAYQNGAVHTLSAGASFFPNVAASGCVIERIEGGCTLETCTSPWGQLPVSNAGLLGVSGGRFPVALQQGSDGSYVFGLDGGADALWLGGEMLSVAGSGADVPAFAAHLRAPTEVVLTQSLPSTLSLAAPLLLQWAGDSAGAIALDVSTSTGADKRILECRFDPAAARGVVPAAALARLPGGPAQISVSSLVEADVAAGQWLVKVFAQTNAEDPGGNECAASVNLH